MSLRPAAERTAANAVASFIQQSRFDSISTNRPVVVRYNAAIQQLQATRTSASAVTNCAGQQEPERTLALTDYRGVSTTDTEFAILWLPSGQPRACPSGTSPLDFDSGATFRVSGATTTLTISVSAGGEVQLQ